MPFPTGRADEYYDQLTGERLEVVAVRGKRPERRWKPINPNVEALDARVYAYAALLLHGTDRLREPTRQPSPLPQQQSKRPVDPRRVKTGNAGGSGGSWMARRSVCAVGQTRPSQNG